MEWNRYEVVVMLTFRLLVLLAFLRALPCALFAEPQLAPQVADRVKQELRVDRFAVLMRITDEDVRPIAVVGLKGALQRTSREYVAPMLPEFYRTNPSGPSQTSYK